MQDIVALRCGAEAVEPTMQGNKAARVVMAFRGRGVGAALYHVPLQGSGRGAGQVWTMDSARVAGRAWRDFLVPPRPRLSARLSLALAPLSSICQRALRRQVWGAPHPSAPSCSVYRPRQGGLVGLQSIVPHLGTYTAWSCACVKLDPLRFALAAGECLLGRVQQRGDFRLAISVLPPICI